MMSIPHAARYARLLVQYCLGFVSSNWDSIGESVDDVNPARCEVLHVHPEINLV